MVVLREGKGKRTGKGRGVEGRDQGKIAGEYVRREDVEKLHHVGESFRGTPQEAVKYVMGG